LLFLIDDVQSVVVALTRLAGVAELSAPSEPARLTETADASVKVTSLHYAYVSGHEVLTDVDLSLTAGERVALVGANGAGKTTLAKIMAGVRHPIAGEVRLGGASLDQLGPTATRCAVALVTKEVQVFAGTLADNLRLARPDGTDPLTWSSARCHRLTP